MPLDGAALGTTQLGEKSVVQLKYQLQQAFEKSQAPLGFAPDPAAMERFLGMCHRRRYPGKTAIIRPGDPANTLYYVIEGSLAVILGISAFWYLDNKPADARWLPPDEKRALSACLALEEADRRLIGPAHLLSMSRDTRVLRFVLIYALIQISTYGAIFYLPAEIAALMHRTVGIEVGLVSAVPWICALAAVYFLPRIADHWHTHRGFAALTLLVAGCASFAFPTAGPGLGLLMLSIAVSGFIAVQPLFWTFPTDYLADRAAAGGIALIGTGNLGGFFAPNLKFWADEHFGSPHAGLYLLAGLTVFNALLIISMKTRHSAPNPH